MRRKRRRLEAGPAEPFAVHEEAELLIYVFSWAAIVARPETHPRLTEACDCSVPAGEEVDFLLLS